MHGIDHEESQNQANTRRNGGVEHALEKRRIDARRSARIDGPADRLYHHPNAIKSIGRKGPGKRSDARPARYAAAITQSAVSANQLDLLVQKVSGGNVVPLVAQLVADRDLTRQEIEELKEIIQRAEQRSTVSKVCPYRPIAKPHCK